MNRSTMASFLLASAIGIVYVTPSYAIGTATGGIVSGGGSAVSTGTGASSMNGGQNAGASSVIQQSSTTTTTQNGVPVTGTGTNADGTTNNGFASAGNNINQMTQDTQTTTRFVDLSGNQTESLNNGLGGAAFVDRQGNFANFNSLGVPANVFVGAGIGGGGGFINSGGSESVRQAPLPAPRVVYGPGQIDNVSPFAMPSAIQSRLVMVNGVKVIERAPVVVEYNWPDRATGTHVALDTSKRKATKSYARVSRKEGRKVVHHQRQHHREILK